MLRGSGEWRPALLHAMPISLLILALFYYWFAVANRYVVFLYNHLGATPFDEHTSSRYWMSGLVASGAVVVLYTTANWLLGRVAGLHYRKYDPPMWWRVWLLCVLPLIVGIFVITMVFNQPTLPPLNAAACVVATLIGLSLALMPGSLAAQQPSELGWLIFYGLGIMPSLLLLRAIELPSKGLADGPRAYSLAIGGTLAGAIWLGIITWLRVLRHRAEIRPSRVFVAGLCLSYELMPLVHYVWFVPYSYRYISAASNFFAFDPTIQLGSFLAATIFAVGTAWLQQKLQGASD